MSEVEMEYEISYIGMDQLFHEERHIGNSQSVARHVTYLEERGAQMVTIEELGPVNAESDTH